MSLLGSATLTCKEQNTASHAGCRVLLVEDDAADRRLIEVLLAKSGDSASFQIEPAGTLREATERLSRSDYAVILLDLGLPDSRGLDTIERVRQAAPSIPIVVLTGLADDDAGLDAIKKGAEDYLMKGQSLGYLLARTLRYAVERGQLREHLQRSYDIQRTINTVLSTAMQSASLEEVFEHAIDSVTSIPWLGFDRRGAIFLVQAGPPVLEMMAQLGMPPSVAASCAEVSLGQCTSSEAAVSDAMSRVVYVGQRPECPCCDGDPCHHYLVPIRSAGTMLGIITLYAPARCRHGMEVEQLLGSVADVLSTTIKRRNAEQTQVKLLEKLETTNRELWDFALVVSHDLKVPLRRIKTLADYLLSDYSDEVDENCRMQIEQLQARVVQMNNLIDGALHNSKIGRSERELTQVDMNELVRQITGVLAPPAGIVIVVNDQLPVIECERPHIVRVLQELLGNAIKYIDKAQGCIEVAGEEDADSWRFSVADNGPGLDKTSVERIFQIGGTATSQEGAKGVGVGLPLVRQIIESYGGRIWVESQPAGGSRFIFTLPKRQMEVRRVEPEANTAR